MSTQAASRAVGAVLLLLGAAMVAWSWRTVSSTGAYSLPVSFLGPALAVLGLGSLIHAPPLPVPPRSAMTPFMWLAALAGILNCLLLYFSEVVGLVTPP